MVAARTTIGCSAWIIFPPHLLYHPRWEADDCVWGLSFRCWPPEWDLVAWSAAHGMDLPRLCCWSPTFSTQEPCSSHYWEMYVCIRGLQWEGAFSWSPHTGSWINGLAVVCSSLWRLAITKTTACNGSCREALGYPWRIWWTKVSGWHLQLQHRQQNLEKVANHSTLQGGGGICRQFTVVWSVNANNGGS